MSEHAGFAEWDRDAIAFVGDTLSPFFLQDPAQGNAASLYDAFAQLDPDAAAIDWPYGDAEAVRQGLASMVEGLSEGVTQEIVWEYRRLFVGPGHKVAPPWGSVYTDYDGVIFGASALDLRDWMRENGVSRLADEGDPDDHIGLLLLMMSWLARYRSDLLREFLQLHVLTWSSHYLELLEQCAAHPLYRGLALLTRTTLEGMQAAFSIDVSHPRFFR